MQTRYSVIHWSFSPPRHGFAPACTWITYSAAEHRAALEAIKKQGGYIYDWTH